MNHSSNLPETSLLSAALASLPLEILIKITEFLSTKDILNLSVCSKYLRNIVYIIKINIRVEYDKISELSYFDSFTNVVYEKSWNTFPKSLQILYWECNGILPNSLPDSLKTLELGNRYNQPLPGTALRESQLPNSLERLLLGSDYDQPLPQHLGTDYDHQLQQLPNSLKSLHLSGCCNQPLPQLPVSLQSLSLGFYYDQPLPQLPDSLKSLHLGWCYNQHLSRLPISLKCLHLGYRYDHPLGQFPYSLKNIKAWKKFRYLNSIPSHIIIEFFD